MDLLWTAWRSGITKCFENGRGMLSPLRSTLEIEVIMQYIDVHVLAQT
jgi:hypothetical protein